MTYSTLPSYVQMLRAPFFSSILAPLVAGTVLAAGLSGSFSGIGFALVILLGLGLHGATNVYNDIYDTLQGTDRVNKHRNEFSGGSGILVRHPELLPVMYRLARVCLLIALFATLGLSFAVDRALLPILWGLSGLSVFFSKYYTAAPFKLAYRGLGEVSVWFAFGPMAFLVAAVSQNVGIRPEIIAFMAPTGLSTLSILWLGQMIDLSADVEGGKRGLVSRIGTSASRYGYLAIQLLLVSNIVAAPFMVGMPLWWVLAAVVPYGLLFPKIVRIVFECHANPDDLKPAAKLNVLLHLGFSVMFALGIGLSAL